MHVSTSGAIVINDHTNLKIAFLANLSLRHRTRLAVI